MDTQRKHPSEQLQIGDPVVYLPEGIVTQVIGYAWGSEVGHGPRLTGYHLACGITVQRDVLERYEVPDRYKARQREIGLREPTKRFKL